jgi:subtilisin family serine protease
MITSHGTAVASVLGGLNLGVAKHISIVPIRIGNCDGSRDTEQLNWGLDWIRSLDNPDRDHRPALISMSTYIRTNNSLTASFEHVINGLVLDDYDLASGRPKWSGIPVIVSANNHAETQHFYEDENKDPVVQTSPARMAYRNDPAVASPGFASPGRVISVGGSGRSVVDGVLRDARWQCPMWPWESTEPCIEEIMDGTRRDYGSNYGNTVDIYAPAHNVESAHTSGTDTYRRALDGVGHEWRSGTSFAAPLVAGIAARILQVEKNLSPKEVWERIQDTAQRVPIPFDTDGVDQDGDPTSNNLLALRRYTSSICGTEHP